MKKINHMAVSGCGSLMATVSDDKTMKVCY